MLAARLSEEAGDGSVLVLAATDLDRELVLGASPYPMVAVADDPELVERFGQHELRFTTSLGAPFVGRWWVRAYVDQEQARAADQALLIARTVWGVPSPAELRWCRRRFPDDDHA